MCRKPDEKFNHQLMILQNVGQMDLVNSFEFELEHTKHTSTLIVILVLHRITTAQF